MIAERTVTTQGHDISTLHAWILHRCAVSLDRDHPEFEYGRWTVDGDAAHTADTNGRLW